MARIILIVAICSFLAVTTLSFPSIDSGNLNLKTEPNKAVIAMSEDGQPASVFVGDDSGRAAIGSLFNFSAYLVGAPPNQTAINFVPLITILSGLTGR